jgi:hypothetical protein
MRRLAYILVVAGGLAACGPTPGQARTVTARAALSSNAAWLELESPTLRAELFRDVAQASQAEAGLPAKEPVLFPILQGGELVAAPGLDAKADLLQASDAGQPAILTFEPRSGESWPEDRRESLQGLSEREAAELVARTLLAHWGVAPDGDIQVDRALGAPYAAAYVDGNLRLNPSFLYMAASVGAPSTAPANQ